MVKRFENRESFSSRKRKKIKNKINYGGNLESRRFKKRSLREKFGKSLFYGENRKKIKNSSIKQRHELRNSLKNSLIKVSNIEVKNDELKNLATMIKAESGGESLKGQIAVGYAILNRSRLWKQSINGVLFEKGQFSPVSDGRFNRLKGRLNQSDINLAKSILNGEYSNPIGNATFFQTVSAEKGSWQKKAKNLTNPIRIGNHIFRTEKRFINNTPTLNSPKQMVV